MINFTKCEKCGLSLIIEESIDHQCKKVVDFRYEGDILWMFDGEIWYPRKSNNREVTPRKTTDEVKDPYSIRFIRYPYRTIR